LRAFALASTARVGEGATLRAQEERAGFDMIGTLQNERPPPRLASH
jgi:hypothetical protein